MEALNQPVLHKTVIIIKMSLKDQNLLISLGTIARAKPCGKEALKMTVPFSSFFVKSSLSRKSLGCNLP